MLGFFAAVTRLVPQEAMRDAVKELGAGGDRGAQPEAFEKGRLYAEAVMAGKDPEAAIA